MLTCQKESIDTDQNNDTLLERFTLADFEAPFAQVLVPYRLCKVTASRFGGLFFLS